MIFFKRKHDGQDKSTNIIHSSEYDSLLRRLSEVTSELSTIKTDIKMLQTDCDNLRGNFNRKLKGIKKEEEEAQKVNEEKEINTSGYIPFG